MSKTIEQEYDETFLNDQESVVVENVNNGKLYTCYKASRIVNGWFEGMGLSKTLPPQMFYNYTTARIRSGKVPFIKVTFVEEANKENVVEKKHYILHEDLEAWFVAYVQKNITNKVK